MEFTNKNQQNQPLFNLKSLKSNPSSEQSESPACPELVPGVRSRMVPIQTNCPKILLDKHPL